MGANAKPERAQQLQLGEIGLNNFAPYLMNRIIGRYNGMLRDEMAALDLTTPKMRALAVLSIHSELLIRDLAVYAVVEQSTLSRALDALEADGLVRRVPDPSDSRAVRINLTASGREVFDRLWPSMAETYEHMFSGIDAEERLAFVGTLDKILRNIRLHDF